MPMFGKKALSIRILHNQIYAVKLRDIFAQSPLVLIYQALGGAFTTKITARLQQVVNQQLPDSGVRVHVARMKNTMVRATENPQLEQVFQACNYLVGFSTPEYSQHQGALLPTSKVKPNTTLKEIMGEVFRADGQGPHISQPALKKLVDASVKLTKDEPMVLVSAWYQRHNIRLTDLQAWVKMDTNKVHMRIGALLWSC